VTAVSLRAVKPDEKVAKAPKLTVEQAAAGGNHRDLLVSMRERIARTVSDPDCPPRDLASLTRRLQDIAKEIEALDLRAKQEAGESAVSPDEAFDSSAV
jgi:hypothetical protein